MTEENSNEVPFDIKNMQQLLIDKNIIGTPIPATIDKFTFQKYNLINPPSKSKRVLNSCTVRYFSQAYLFNEISQQLEQVDKNYKNIKKDKISNMSQDKKWIRYCLLLMSEGEQSFFEVPENYLEGVYKKIVDDFITYKKNQKKKELKQIEIEKIKEQKAKEEEELKKKGEYKEPKEEGVIPSKNPAPPNKEKKEIIIDQTIVDDVPNHYKFDGKIYYRIYTEDVLIDKPPFPNKAKDLENYVREFNAEIKRLLIKDGKKTEEKEKNAAKFELNLAESWCNEIISKVLNMGKGKLKDEYESDKFKGKRKIIDEEMKKPILNLMFIYSKKMDNNIQIVRQAINLVESIYYKKYKGQYDQSYLKITGRYILCLIKINDFSKAKKMIEEVKKNCSNLKFKETESLLKEWENILQEAERKKNSENISISKGKLKAAADDSKPNYDWQQGQNEDELNDALNKDAEQVKGNMDLINSNDN